MAVGKLCDALHTSLKESFGSSKYSDLIVRCEGRDFKVHKVIVCGQSNFFSSICDGDWKEAADSIIELKGDSVRAVEAMLEFMYTFDYDESGNNQGRASSMIFNVEVYSIADIYGILALKIRAKEKFDKAVKAYWDIDDFVHAITEVYTSTPSTDRGLRDTVVEVAREYISTLLDKEEFQSVLEETVGFAADVTRLMAKSEVPSLTEFYCPHCGHEWEASLQLSTIRCLRCDRVKL